MSAAATQAIIRWSIARSARIPPKEDPNSAENAVLYHGKLMKGAVFFELACIPLFVYGFFWEALGRDELTTKIIGTISLALLAIMFSWEGLRYVREFRSQITIAGDFIHAKGSVSKTIRWEDIVRITFSGLYQSIVLTDKNNITLRVSCFYHGIGYFAWCITQKLDPFIYSRAKQSIDQILGYVPQKLKTKWLSR